MTDSDSDSKSVYPGSDCVACDLPPARAKRGTFSDFIRNATPEEKEAVYLQVIDRVNARQLEVIAQAALMMETRK